jgi:hypothetical protein
MSPTLSQQIALSRLAELTRPTPRHPGLLEQLRALRERV